MVPLPPLRDGGCALPICPFGRACLPLISDAPDCTCSPGRLWFLGDGHERTVSLRRGNFNPRAPCGARHVDGNSHRFTLWISIHAPRVGRDGRYGQDRPSRCNFNPRAPCGARPWSSSVSKPPLAFQSTRPVWGATYKPSAVGVDVPYFNPRAPCGARQQSGLTSFPLPGFQSTRPVWGATGCRSCRVIIECSFQSTRPVWGATICSTSLD